MRRSDWLIVALLAFCFSPAVLALARVWSQVDYYSHGFLVPAVAAWAATQRRPGSAELERRADPRALGFLIAVLLGYVASLAVGSVSGQGLALVCAVGGVVWLLFGLRVLRHFAFPVAYLIFMVPIPPAWLTPAVLQLQLFVSQGAVALSERLAVPVERAGNVIWLPDGEALFVAEACSGVTSVVTLTPLAVLLAALAGLGALRSSLLVAAVVPVAMASNLVRVVATLLAAHRFGADAVTREPLHSLAGLAVYVLACLVLLVLWRLLSRPAVPEPAAAT